MVTNVGGLDRILRIVLGLVLIAYAIPIGFPHTGWNFVGWIGVSPASDRADRLMPALQRRGNFDVPA